MYGHCEKCGLNFDDYGEICEIECNGCDTLYCEDCVEDTGCFESSRQHCDFFKFNRNLIETYKPNACKSCTTKKKYIQVTDKEKLELVMHKCGITYKDLLKKCGLSDSQIINEIKNNISKSRKKTKEVIAIDDVYGIKNYIDCEHNCKIYCSDEYYLDPNDEIGVIPKSVIIKNKVTVQNSQEVLRLKNMMIKYSNKFQNIAYEYLYTPTFTLKNLGLKIDTHLMKCLFIVIDEPIINDYLKEYLETCNEINKSTKEGFTALHIACELFGRSKNTDLITTINILIDKGANINQITKYGSTPLHIVLYHYNMCEDHKELIVQLIKKFVDNGSDIYNIKNKVNACVFDLILRHSWELKDEIEIDKKNRKITFATGKLTKPAKK